MQLSTSGLVVAFVGRLNRWKGAEILVEAAALIKANGILAKVIIAGDAPAGEESRVGDLQDRIERAALEEHVEVIGFCDDVPALLATVDVVVVPSLWPEPFGLVTAEAMRAGRVVVASRHGAATELLDGGSSGVLVPPGDVPALAAALKRLAQDPELRQRLGAAARRRIETVFTRERFVADLLAVYDSVAE
jgi:glycosyltransferase involved in cell wall biosynthesis